MITLQLPGESQGQWWKRLLAFDDPYVWQWACPPVVWDLPCFPSHLHCTPLQVALGCWIASVDCMSQQLRRSNSRMHYEICTVTCGHVMTPEIIFLHSLTPDPPVEPLENLQCVHDTCKKTIFAIEFSLNVLQQDHQLMCFQYISTYIKKSPSSSWWTRQ